MKLYDYPKCPFCKKVRVVLVEKGLQYEKVLVDLRRKEQQKAEFLRLNPYGKVPVLQDGDTVIYESTVINEYLEEKYPDPPLMPSDPAGKAWVRIWVDFCEQHFGTPWFNLMREIVFKRDGSSNQEVIKESGEEIARYLEQINEKLEGRDYLVGKYSLADVAFTPRIATFKDLGIEVGPKLKNARAWIERVKARPSYSAVQG